jgi:hypothetical protein
MYGYVSMRTRFTLFGGGSERSKLSFILDQGVCRAPGICVYHFLSVAVTQGRVVQVNLRRFKVGFVLQLLNLRLPNSHMIPFTLCDLC